MMMRQLHFAMLDLELHARYQPGGTESVFDVDHRIAQQTMVMKPLQEDRYTNAALHMANAVSDCMHNSMSSLAVFDLKQ